MSELDEINPPDALSYNPHFFAAANEFISMVGCRLQIPKKSKAVFEQLSDHLKQVKLAAKPEFDNLNTYMDLLNIDSTNDKDVPRSTKFCLFADEIYKNCTGKEASQCSENYQAIYDSIFKKFLTKTFSEANYLINQMAIIVKQLDPECDNEATQREFNDDPAQQASFCHILLDINRTRANDVHQTREESAQKLFNFSVFKLACIFERFRLYMHDIVQPRDNKLQVIEVNLDSERNQMLAGERFISIWEKNDFIMTYQVLQIINNEIIRIEKKNLDRSLFNDSIMMLLSQDSRVDPNKTIAGSVSDRSMLSEYRDHRPGNDKEKVLQDRRLMQAFFLQGNRNLGKEAFRIHQERWALFTMETRRKQLRQQETQMSLSMEQEVFLLFKVELKKSKNLAANETRIFQLELMYQSGSAISQKVKFVQQSSTAESGLAEEHKFLFLQIPYKLLLGTDVFMIIKVFTSTLSKAACEHEYIWTPNKSSRETRNQLKFYEGFAMVNISDIIWSKNIKCGAPVRLSVQFCKPDKVQVVDDRFLQIFRELSFEKHSELQKEHQPVISFTIFSDLVTHANNINLKQTKIVMMKRFMRTLYKSRDFSASQFLNNEPGSLVRSYTNEQLYEIERQIRQYLYNLNEIKLDLHSLHFSDAVAVKQPFVRLQIFFRQKDQGCFEQVYGTFDEIMMKKFSY